MHREPPPAPVPRTHVTDHSPRAHVQVAKMFRYLGFTSFCDVLFAIFTVSWVITRQIMFSLVFVSTWKSVKKLPFKWDPEAGHYLNMYIYIGFLVLLGTLVVRF